VNELAIHIAGFGPKEADNMRRAFGRHNNNLLLEGYFYKFINGALRRGVSKPDAKKIFNKFSGQYMFPESHAYAFGITAYQMAWLKFHYPLEFYVAIFNQQPMGFYNIETLKEDANRHGIEVLNPNINKSMDRCVIKDETSFLLGLSNVKGLGTSKVKKIIDVRKHGQTFNSLRDMMWRTAIEKSSIESLIMAGAFDSLIADRKSALWEVGLLHSKRGDQQRLPFPTDQDMPELAPLTRYQMMMDEYRTMDIYPTGHIMRYIRERISGDIATSRDIKTLAEGTRVDVVGLVIRRQKPNTDAIFITLEDEFGHIPILVWTDIFDKYRLDIMKPVLKISGEISRRQGSLTIVSMCIRGIGLNDFIPRSKNWM